MYEVKLPRLGQTMQSGTISAWLMDEGDSIDKGDYLFELQSEKSTLEVESPVTGILRKILIEEDNDVPVGTVVAIIGDQDEEIDFSTYLNKKEEKSFELTVEESPKTESRPEEKQQIGATPRARRLAKELGVDITSITGTGKGSIITEDDVKNAANASSIKIKEVIELNNIQKSMSKHLLNSWQSIPHFTQMITVNMDQTLSVKKELNPVSLNALITKEIALAVKEVPIVNSRLENDRITIFDDVNVSTAINSSQGLVVPVVKNTESKSANEIQDEIKNLVEKANNNKLSPEDFADGTITVSNLGSMGIEEGTPVINSPQSTLVFVGAIKKTPIVDNDGQIAVANLMKLSICFDHRFIDGAAAAQFTKAVKDRLEMLKVEDVVDVEKVPVLS
jgi:pyruvate dehydrogenase E2 component (dihydrolipoamide acetyltransferase)